ncbi:MAG: hypothetical protein AAGN35_13335 [Bacteroidota bacterium]
MKKILLLLLPLVLGAQVLPAKFLLEDIEMDSGRWEMIGVSLINYEMLDIQHDLGSFIMTDQYRLKEIQSKWDFEEVFEDYCDYHYALKFYKDGELQKTLRVNLVCNYITDGAFSYRFDMNNFLEYRRYYKPIRWSRIRFRDLDLLQVAVDQLDNLPSVYWYGDVKQYDFDGDFSITVDDLPWNANRDSVVAEVTDRIRADLGRDDFYVTQKYWLLSDDFETMTLRLNIFCNASLYDQYGADDVITRWRNHFSEMSFVQIVVIGLSKKEYFETMQGYN